MPTPRYARKVVTINPVFDVPSNIEGVEVGEEGLFNPLSAELDNSYIGPIRDDGTYPPGSDIGTNMPNPTPGGPPVSQQNIAKLVKQELVITLDGRMVVEVTVELPDTPLDYEVGVTRV